MLDALKSHIWEAMRIGPQWILRDAADPLKVETPAPQVAPQAPTAPAARPTAAPAQPVKSLKPQKKAPEARPAAKPEAAPAAQSVAALPAQTIELIKKADWEALTKLACACEACPMAKTRQHVVTGEVSPGARFAVVGEAPGSEEDLQGVPFVGKSGQLMNAMLDVLGIERKRDVHVLNVVKCRPPGNRNPTADEAAACTHYLKRQLELLAPDVVLLAGRFAAASLLPLADGQTLTSLRGRIHEVELAGKRVAAVVTYHPSYLLRRPEAKLQAWEDLCLLEDALMAHGMDFRSRRREEPGE